MVSELREDGIDVGSNQTRQIVQRTMEREDLSKARTGDREVPPTSRLRFEQRQLPAFECWSPSSNDRLHGSNQLGTQTRIAHLRTANRN